MKLAISIWCVVMFSLFAVRARAQLDSNAMVTFSCPTICDSCSMSVYVGSSLDTSNKGYTYTQPASLCLSYDSTFRITSGAVVDYVNGATEITFSIDPEYKLFRNVTISKTASLPPCPDCVYSGNGSVGDRLWVSVDSIPYSESAGVLTGRGFSNGSNFAAGADCQNGHSGCSGTCFGKDVSQHAIFITVVPFSPSRVVQNGAPAQKFTLMFDKTSESVQFEYRAGVNVIKIYGLLGREIENISIDAGSTILDLSRLNLPSGFYFARLGDQVAKFIVPPR